MPDSPTLNVAILGGGMFFDDIIGQSFKDLMRAGVAPAHPNQLTGPDCVVDGDCPAFMVIKRQCSDGGRSLQFYEEDTVNVLSFCSIP